MATYKDAVQWIADNDDADLGDPDEGGFIVSIHLVADLFRKDAGKVWGDVSKRRDLDRRSHQRAVWSEEEEEGRMMDAMGLS